MTYEEKQLEEYFKRPVAYKAEFAKALGNVNLAVLLSQFYYWRDKGYDPEGWFYKSRKEIFDETGLTRQAQETARKYGRMFGVLEEIKKGNPRRLYFRINTTILLKLIKEYKETNQPASRRKGRQQVGGFPANKLADNQPALYTENTSEIKSESISKNTRAEKRRQLFNEKIFKQGDEWQSTNRKTVGPELNQIISWTIKNFQGDVLDQLSYFLNYWSDTELNSESKKCRWKLQSYFDVCARLKGWLKNAPNIQQRQDISENKYSQFG